MYNKKIIIKNIKIKFFYLEVGAYGSSSFALTKEGEIYEWGQYFMSKSENFEKIDIKFN